MKRIALVIASAMISVTVPSLAWASHSTSAPDAGWGFEVPEPTAPVYEIQEPQEDSELQRRHVEAFDGEQIWVETWLPEDPSTGEPLTGIPTVVTYSPYAKKGSPPNTHFGYMADLVRRGYAFTTVHVRGTGESSGCIDPYGAVELNDGERALKYIANADWSNGELGLIGLSYPGNTAVNLTANGSEETRSYIKALVVGAPGHPLLFNFDGVHPYVHGGGSAVVIQYGLIPYSTPADVVFWAEPPERVVESRTSEGGFSPVAYWGDRPGCHPTTIAADADPSASISPYFQEREFRKGASAIEAPTFMFHGFEDAPVRSRVQAGLFERIGAPKFGLFGHFWHETPDDHYSGIEPEWERTDFKAMVIAWIDRHLSGIDNGIDSWPTAQVQDNTGQWRAEADWPTTGGPVGQLVLGDDSVLGDTTPSGSSTYQEDIIPFDRDFALRNDESTRGVFNSDVIFRTDPLRGPLHITGQPLADLWVTLEMPEGESPLGADAHVAVELIARRSDGSLVPYASNFGARSLMHLEPLQDNLFLQATGIAPPTGVPLRVPVRMEPVDFVVPQGGWLELRISGSGRVEPGLEPREAPTVFQHPSRTSGRAAIVTVLHDCEHQSALRFLMPRRNADLVNVREEDEGSAPLATTQTKSEFSDGGGIASAAVCGQAPSRALDVIPTLGEELHYGWNPHSGSRTGGY